MGGLIVILFTMTILLLSPTPDTQAYQSRTTQTPNAPPTEPIPPTLTPTAPPPARATALPTIAPTMTATPVPTITTTFTISAEADSLRVHLPDATALSWVQVWVGTPDLQQLHLQWYELATSATCQGLACTLPLAASFAPGEYVVYIQPWGPDGFIVNDVEGWLGPVGTSIATPQLSPTITPMPTATPNPFPPPAIENGSQTVEQVTVDTVVQLRAEIDSATIGTTKIIYMNPGTAYDIAGINLVISTGKIIILYGNSNVDPRSHTTSDPAQTVVIENTSSTNRTLLFLGPNAHLTLYNLVMRNGTGQAAAGAINSSGDLRIVRSKISDNSASFGGALLLLDPGSNVDQGNTRIENSLILDNQASGGGAIDINGTHKLTVTCTTFETNIANETGGAISFGGSESPSANPPQILIQDSNFVNNIAMGLTPNGSAAYNHYTNANLFRVENVYSLNNQFENVEVVTPRSLPVDILACADPTDIVPEPPEMCIAQLERVTGDILLRSGPSTGAQIVHIINDEIANGEQLALLGRYTDDFGTTWHLVNYDAQNLTNVWMGVPEVLDKGIPMPQACLDLTFLDIDGDPIADSIYDFEIPPPPSDESWLTLPCTEQKNSLNHQNCAKIVYHVFYWEFIETIERQPKMSDILAAVAENEGLGILISTGSVPPRQNDDGRLIGHEVMPINYWSVIFSPNVHPECLTDPNCDATLTREQITENYLVQVQSWYQEADLGDVDTDNIRDLFVEVDLSSRERGLTALRTRFFFNSDSARQWGNYGYDDPQGAYNYALTNAATDDDILYCHIEREFINRDDFRHEITYEEDNRGNCIVDCWSDTVFVIISATKLQGPDISYDTSTFDIRSGENRPPWLNERDILEGVVYLPRLQLNNLNNSIAREVLPCQ